MSKKIKKYQIILENCDVINVSPEGCQLSVYNMEHHFHGQGEQAFHGTISDIVFMVPRALESHLTPENINRLYTKDVTGVAVIYDDETDDDFRCRWSDAAGQFSDPNQIISYDPEDDYLKIVTMPEIIEPAPSEQDGQ
jgi:hypothetical protein